MIMSIISADYLPYEEAAAKLGLSKESLRRYIHGGKIEAEKLGRTYFVHVREVSRYQSERQPVGRPAEKLRKRA